MEQPSGYGRDSYKVSGSVQLRFVLLEFNTTNKKGIGIMALITNQMIFNAAWQEFVVKGESPAVKFYNNYNECDCCYYTEDGKRCAVGLVLPDEVAKEIYSGISLGNMLGDSAQIGQKYGPLFDKDNCDGEIQGALHDNLINRKTGEWKKGINLREEYLEVAKKYNLTVPE